MERSEFEQLVDDGISQIPGKFLEELENVSIVIDDFPSPYQLQKMRRHYTKWGMFGLYEGVPKTKRGTNYSGFLPDKITIFKKPIEAYSQSPEQVKQIVTNVVWHEIAHHFGMNEQEVRESERRRGHRY
ncbi:MAG: metallopeptidase family protein [Candidatus Dojkabacteria bacterium]